MSSEILDVQRLHRPLLDAGLVPQHCRLVELSVGVRGALVIRYEVFITAEQLVRLGGVLQTLGEEVLLRESKQSISDRNPADPPISESTPGGGA